LLKTLKTLTKISKLDTQLNATKINQVLSQRLYLQRTLKALKNRVIICTAQHTHYSIKKIASQLSLRIIEIPANPKGSMCNEQFYTTVNQLPHKNPYTQIILVTNVETTLFGAIDDIPSLHTLLKRCIRENNAHIHYTIHADAALLGVALPILKPFGHLQNYFTALGVNTITISGLGTSLPCSMVLTSRDYLCKTFPQESKVCVEYIGNINDITFSGCVLD
jgi:glutamate/tyrosine decarboxylase-like PLP-dependent enzyme